jgi:hypothetical protein
MEIAERQSTGCSVSRRYCADKNGAPGGIRTPDPLLRRQMLYPTELRALGLILKDEARSRPSIYYVLFYNFARTGKSTLKHGLCRRSAIWLAWRLSFRNLRLRLKLHEESYVDSRRHPFSEVPRSAAKHAAESKRGRHSQSIEPFRPTSAAVSQLPINA